MVEWLRGKTEEEVEEVKDTEYVSDKRRATVLDCVLYYDLTIYKVGRKVQLNVMRTALSSMNRSNDKKINKINIT